MWGIPTSYLQLPSHFLLPSISLADAQMMMLKETKGQSPKETGEGSRGYKKAGISHTCLQIEHKALNFLESK